MYVVPVYADIMHYVSSPTARVFYRLIRDIHPTLGRTSVGVKVAYEDRKLKKRGALNEGFA